MTGSILATRAPISRANSESKHMKISESKLKSSYKSVQGEKVMEKEDSKLFKHKADFSTGILLIYHFVLNLTTKSFTLLKHRDVFAYVLVCKSCEKT